MNSARPQIGSLLLKGGVVTQDQVDFSLIEQKATGERLGECLQRLGFVSDVDLARVIAEQASLPFIDLRSFTPNPSILRLLPGPLARQHRILPLSQEGARLAIAVSDPYDQNPIEVVFRITGMHPIVHVGGEAQIRRLVERFYYLIENPVEQVIEDAVQRLKAAPAADIDANRLLDAILASAVGHRGTDVHLTPSNLSSRVMVRIDGVMELAHVFPLALHNRLVTTVKVRAGMDISEQRKPQDGRMTFEFLADRFDIRVSTIRTNFGENVVMRLLPSHGSFCLSLNELGLSPEEFSRIERGFSRPHGIILAAGPTGSGKSTTLYAALRRQDTIKKNILTVEDPIEYEFLMVRQTQVNERAGYTFASAIRSFLRQDPDVILVGEIRDEETAILATRAALTGHLVLSTLHTNTAIGAIARLRDLNVSPYLISSSLACVISQRLVRLLCPACKRPDEPDSNLLKYYGLPRDGKYYRHGGCKSCRGTGYAGRSVICEVLEISPEMARIISEDAPIGKIEERVYKEGFEDILASARRKVLAGETDLDELRRVLG